MRMALGLAGILVTVGVIVWIMSAITLPATKQALDVKKKIQPQVEQIAGHSATGTRAADTIKIKGEERGGKMVSVLVTDITLDGAMETYFGLKKGDSIVEIGPLPVQDMGTASEVKDYLVAEYQRSGQIKIKREGLDMMLPLAPKAKPAAPAGGVGGTGDSVQKQLEAIPGLPR